MYHCTHCSLDYCGLGACAEATHDIKAPPIAKSLILPIEKHLRFPIKPKPFDPNNPSAAVIKHITTRIAEDAAYGVHTTAQLCEMYQIESQKAESYRNRIARDDKYDRMKAKADRLLKQFHARTRLRMKQLPRFNETSVCCPMGTEEPWSPLQVAEAESGGAPPARQGWDELVYAALDPAGLQMDLILIVCSYFAKRYSSHQHRNWDFHTGWDYLPVQPLSVLKWKGDHHLLHALDLAPPPAPLPRYLRVIDHFKRLVADAAAENAGGSSSKRSRSAGPMTAANAHPGRNRRHHQPTTPTGSGGTAAAAVNPAVAAAAEAKQRDRARTAHADAKKLSGWSTAYGQQLMAKLAPSQISIDTAAADGPARIVDLLKGELSEIDRKTIALAVPVIRVKQTTPKKAAPDQKSAAATDTARSSAGPIQIDVLKTLTVPCDLVRRLMIKSQWQSRWISSGDIHQMAFRSTQQRICFAPIRVPRDRETIEFGTHYLAASLASRISQQSVSDIVTALARQQNAPSKKSAKSALAVKDERKTAALEVLILPSTQALRLRAVSIRSHQTKWPNQIDVKPNSLSYLSRVSFDSWSDFTASVVDYYREKFGPRPTGSAQYKPLRNPVMLAPVKPKPIEPSAPVSPRSELAPSSIAECVSLAAAADPTLFDADRYYVPRYSVKRLLFQSIVDKIHGRESGGSDLPPPSGGIELVREPSVSTVEKAFAAVEAAERKSSDQMYWQEVLVSGFGVTANGVSIADWGPFAKAAQVCVLGLCVVVRPSLCFNLWLISILYGVCCRMRSFRPLSICFAVHRRVV